MRDLDPLADPEVFYSLTATERQAAQIRKMHRTFADAGLSLPRELQGEPDEWTSMLAFRAQLRLPHLFTRKDPR